MMMTFQLLAFNLSKNSVMYVNALIASAARSTLIAKIYQETNDLIIDLNFHI